MAKKRKRPKQTPKPLTKAGKISVAISLAVLAVVILVSSLVSKSPADNATSSTTTMSARRTTTSTTLTSVNYVSDVTFTYSAADVKPWPWKAAKLTIHCTTSIGSSVSIIDGQTYGMSDRDALNWQINGYTSDDELLAKPRPMDGTTPESAFEDRAYRDCKNVMSQPGH